MIATNNLLPDVASATDAKSCCATLYASELATLLLGDSFHPGGLALTERLGALLSLPAGSRVLDVAAGRGASAIRLAQRFEWQLVGTEYSATNVERARAAAVEAGVSHLVTMQQGDAEQLNAADGEFDAVICECAYCTFPNKIEVAREFARVLRPAGQVILSDVVLNRDMPPTLRGLLSWIACIADARPIADYVAFLTQAGLEYMGSESHDDALSELVKHIRTRLLGLQTLVAINKTELPGIDLAAAQDIARHAAAAVQDKTLGYALLAFRKSSSESVCARDTME